MRRMLIVAVWAVLSVNAWAQDATQTSGADEWGKLVAANNLDVKGNTPFHLAMTFQLYDMDGKATKTGTFEEWWAAQGAEKIVVHLPGLNEDGKAPEGADAAVARDAYLVSQLMNAAVHPVPPEPGDGVKTTNETRKFGKAALSCVVPEPDHPPQVSFRRATLCLEPKTDEVRVLLESDGHGGMIRNSEGTFHSTFVALELQISFLGRNAITGKVTMLQSFDPAKSEVKLPPATSPAASQHTVVSISGGVIAGHRVKFVLPEYPELAKMRHASGSVLLRAIIGKDGSVERLVPIASTAPMFTDAAMQSVKQWVYLPYLLNGESTEVDTTITVNFALNGG